LVQAFGVNPVTKHNPAEFTAISALLWLPVSLITILFYNFVIKISQIIIKAKPIWTVDDLKNMSGSFLFLFAFLIISLIISFIISVLWAKWGHKYSQKVINKVRIWRGTAPFSNTPSVWDEVFGNNNPQVVEIGKIDRPGESMIGCIKKVSRPFEPERNICLEEVEGWTNYIKENEVPIENIFYDTKSGTYVKIYDITNIS